MAWSAAHYILHRYNRPRHSEIATPKFDNRKKIDFFKTIIDFWKKTKLTSLDMCLRWSIIKLVITAVIASIAVSLAVTAVFCTCHSYWWTSHDTRTLFRCHWLSRSLVLSYRPTATVSQLLTTGSGHRKRFACYQQLYCQLCQFFSTVELLYNKYVKLWNFGGGELERIGSV